MKNIGFNLLDALNISSTEIKGLDRFLSTDNDLLDSYNKNKGSTEIEISNPLDWIKEVYL